MSDASPFPGRLPRAANAILLDVLKQHPRYTPALARLCTFRVNAMGQAATGIRYCEQALALDPLLEDIREGAYRSLARGTALPMSMADHIMAVRMHARMTGDFKRAQGVLGQVSGVRWDASGAPTLPVDTSPVRDTAIALADVLVAGDEAAKFCCAVTRHI